MWDNILASAIVIFSFIAFVFIVIQIINTINLRKRKAYFEELHKSLKPGVRVMINGSIFGKAIKVYNDDLIVEISKGTEIRVSRYSISEIIKED